MPTKHYDLILLPCVRERKPLGVRRTYLTQALRTVTRSHQVAPTPAPNLASRILYGAPSIRDVRACVHVRVVYVSVCSPLSVPVLLLSLDQAQPVAHQSLCWPGDSG